MHNEESHLSKMIVSLENNMVSKLNNLKIVTGLYLSLEERVQLDNTKIEENTFTKDDLKVSKEVIKTISELAGFKDVNISFENFDNDINVSIEELDGEKQSLLSRFKKVWSDSFEDIKTNNTELVAVWNVYVKKETSKIESILEKIKSGKLKFKSTKFVNEYLNTDLAVYFEMYGQFNVNTFLDFIKTPQELIIKEHLFKDVNKFGYDQLVVSKDNEDTIPTHHSSVNFLDKIKDKEIRKWLDKDTKWGILFPIIGKRINILSLCQNEKEGAYTSLRKFNIQDNKYVNQSIEIKSENDFKNIIKTVEEMLNNVDNIDKELKSVKEENLSKFVRSELATIGYFIGFSFFAIRRILRQLDARINFYGSAIFASYKLANNHLDSLGMVYTILHNCTEEV